MALTELILGATRGTQLLLSIITIGLTSGSIHSLIKDNTGSYAINGFALFVAVWAFLCVLFLVTSQFLFIHQYNGYSVYITTGVILELVNWVFIFAAWVGVAQFGNSPNCVYDSSIFSMFRKTCDLDRAVLGFLILLWLTWTVSLAIMIKLKINEHRDSTQSKEIELRIKNVVEETTKQRNSAAVLANQQVPQQDGQDLEAGAREGHEKM